MRQIGTIADAQQAHRFAKFLISEGIKAKAMEEDGGWSVWVNDEDQLASARDALASFNQNPDHPKYAAALKVAAQIEKQENTARLARSKKMIDVRRDVWRPPTASQMPVTTVLIGICIAVAIFSGMGERRAASPMRELLFCDPTHTVEPGFDASRDGFVDIKAGQFWRAATPMFIHYGLIHILFNMMWLHTLGSRIEIRRSSALLGALVLSIALISNIAEYIIGQSPWFGGMSGVVYGLFGFIWVRMLFYPKEQLFVSQQNITIMMVWLVLCFTGFLGPIANWAHLFGLIAGAALGYMIPAKSTRQRASS